ncbi:MAG: 2-oxo acid dehydrogenase subunit E2 [Pseudomonadota bacterium]
MPDLDQGVRLSGVRGLIARRMSDSLTQAAQLSFHASVDASAALAQVEAARGQSHPVTLEDIAAWSYVRCLSTHLNFNGVIKDNTFFSNKSIHLGVALGVGDHLLVGVIRDAETLVIEQLAEARRALVRDAREGKLTPDKMRDGTSTISNLGPGRTESFTPILNPPQVALLGLCTVRKKAWVTEDGSIDVRPVMGVSLTVDHRWIDGAPANSFLANFCSEFESVRSDRGLL